MEEGFSPAFWGALLLCFGGYLAFRGLKRGEFFKPVPLFLSMHSLAMGFALLELFWTFTGFHFTYYVVAIASWACFALGGWVADTFTPTPANSTGTELWPVTNRSLIVPLAGMVGLFALSRIAGGWPVFAALPETAKSHLITGRTTAFLFSFGIFAQLYSMEKLVLHRKWIFLATFLAISVMIAFTGNRGQILLSILFGLSLAETTLRKRIGLFAFGSVVVFLLVFLVIGYVRMRGANPLGESLSAFNGAKMAYVYLVNGQWNMSYGLEKILKGKHYLTYGVSSFNGVIFWFADPSGLQESLGWDSAMNESIQFRRGLNSASFQWIFLKDFGIAGMFALTTFFGYVATRLYRAAKFGGSSALLSALLAFPIMFSFNSFWLIEGTGSMATMLLAANLVRRKMFPVAKEPS